MTVRPLRWPAPAAGALGLAVAAVALLGPLGTGKLRYRVPPSVRDQLAATDAVALALVAPLGLLAAALLRRRAAAGPLLAVGTALCAWYLTALHLLVPDRGGHWPGDDAVFLPLLVGVLLLSSAVAIGAWRSLPSRGLTFDRPTRDALGGLLLAVVALAVGVRYLPAWVALVRGTATTSGPWEAAAFLDLALLLPAAATTGTALLRGARWAVPAAFAVGQLLFVGAVAVAVMTWPASAGGLPGAAPSTVVAAASAAPALVCWIAVLRSTRRGWRPAPVPAVPPPPARSSPAAAASLPTPRTAGAGVPPLVANDPAARPLPRRPEEFPC